jgi:hypothetical protein
MAKALFAVIFCLWSVLAVAGTPSTSVVEWSALTPPQQKILGPLKGEWGKFDTSRRKKWVNIAESYSKMKPEQQQRLTARMQQWTKLTPQQREIAREKYKSMSPQQRSEAQWNKYLQSRGAHNIILGAPTATTARAQ